MYNYIFDKENCWYKEVCNSFLSHDCNAGCIRYMEIDYLMKHSGIPKNKQIPDLLTPDKVDIDAFILLREIKDDILNFVTSGENLYIYSTNFGNGKTSWAIKLLEKYFDEIWAGNGFKCRGVFINVPTFLTKIKEGIGRRDEEFEILKGNLIDADIVVWDDIAATKLSDYDHTNLLTYIDQRVLNGKSNIFTGNIIPSSLPDFVGNRLASRIWEKGTSVQFLGIDKRGSKQW